MGTRGEVIAAAVSALLGEDVSGVRELGGSVYLVSLPGRVAVAKRGIGPHATAAEAAGLRWLGESGDVPVPRVETHDDEWLVIGYVFPGAPVPEAAEALGRGLAALHLRGAAAFGSAPPGGPADAWSGMAAMRDEPCADWAEFYWTHRMQPYVRRCADQGLFTADQVAVFERVGARLPELGGPPEPPARLHGDLWSGNVHWAADGRAWLIDPAAHGGHREADLAMLRLFGTPLLDRILGAYVEVAPPADGWTERVTLHQLFPLLVHAELFGGGYAAQALAAARTALGAAR